MQVPKVTKVTSTWDGRGHSRRQGDGGGGVQLAQITGQKGQVRRARKSVANFKLRAGMPVGLRVTLRGDRMYEMLDRLVSISLPRIRDFRGISPSGFDGRGNFNMGVKEQIIFPEIDYDKIDKMRGHGHRHHHYRRDGRRGTSIVRMMGMPFRES